MYERFDLLEEEVRMQWVVGVVIGRIPVGSLVLLKQSMKTHCSGFGFSARFANYKKGDV
jgi:hypothetical protein